MQNQKAPPNVLKVWKEAKRAQLNAHAPYSKFFVGAAFRSKKRIYSGCNVENASYGATLCAERVAITKAISEGARGLEDLVIVANTESPTPPCGLCLQVLTEFAEPGLRIWLANRRKIFGVYAFKELMSLPFSKKRLKAP